MVVSKKEGIVETKNLERSKDESSKRKEKVEIE